MDEPYCYKFPLNDDSIVFSLGGYLGEWDKRIFDLYKCKLYIFEPVADFYNIIVDVMAGTGAEIYNIGISDKTRNAEIHVKGNASSLYITSGNPQQIKLKNIDEFIFEKDITEIDLMKINIEGEEYNILPYMMVTKTICRIKYLLIQFHPFIDKAEEKRQIIIGELSKTHRQIFNKQWEWEVWERK